MNGRLRAWRMLCDLLFSADGFDVVKGLAERLGDERLETEMVSLANASFVTAALWVAVCRKGLEGALSENIRDYLYAFYALNRQRNERLLGQLMECVSALNQASVTPMPLKGSAHLLSELYSDPGERFLADIDLLVPVDEMPVAAAALADIEFRPAPTEFDFSQHHHLPTLVRTPEDVAVELHSAPVSQRAQAGLGVDEIWAGAIMVNQAGHRWCVATATDTAMLSFLHGEIADRNLARCILDLRGFLDLQRLLQRSGRAIDWSRNLDRARRCRSLSTFHRYLYVFKDLTGMSIMESNRTRWRDRIYSAVCRSAIRWPAIQRWANDIQALASYRLMRRYKISDRPLVLNAYRIRALGGMIRNRLIGRPRSLRPRGEND